MEWFLEKANTLVIHYFHKLYGLVSAGFLLGIVSLFVYGLLPNGRVRFLWYLYCILGVELFIVVFWLFYKYYYPKRSKNRLGVAVAVYVESLEDNRYFKKDFLTPFKTKIIELGLPFDVLVIRNHQSEKVENVEDARKVLKKTKAHFCIWGSIKKRKNGKEGDKYLFSLRGIVVHQPILEVQKVLLIKEFTALLPNTIAFEEGFQFELFDLRANQAVAALDYITGRAALLSGDFNIAINLHEALFLAMQGGQQFQVSKDTLKKLLALEYDLKANFELFNNKPCEQSITKSLQYDQNNYGALLKKAVLEFNSGTGDAKLALKTIKQAKINANKTYNWLYSETFLHLWLEEYPEAIKCCDKLKEKNYVGEEVTIKEVIDFNENLLKKIQRPQLYYWLGFVSYVKDNNYSRADQYFQNFLDKADDSMKDLKIRAKSYLSNIKKEIKY